MGLASGEQGRRRRLGAAATAPLKPAAAHLVRAADQQAREPQRDNSVGGAGQQRQHARLLRRCHGCAPGGEARHRVLLVAPPPLVPPPTTGGRCAACRAGPG